MVKPKEHNGELFFVRVKDPNEVRKNILETLKDIVEVLRRFEKFRQTRHHKIEKIGHLRIVIKEANKMLGDLRAKLPQTNLRAVVVKEAKHAKKTHHKKKKGKSAEEKMEKAPRKEATELDKLEAELSAIEGKLKSLA